jgi:hypothetical protein
MVFFLSGLRVDDQELAAKKLQQTFADDFANGMS